MAKATYICINAGAQSGDRMMVRDFEDEGEAIATIRQRVIAASREVEYLLIRLPETCPGQAELVTRIKMTVPTSRMNAAEAEAYGDSHIKPPTA